MREATGVDEKKQYAEESLATLQEAIKAGWKDNRGLESDPDLEAIRALPGYKEVVEGMKRK